MELPLNQILEGDSLNVLQDFPENSVDLCLTDGPYGISIMQKKWDVDVPSVELWQQVLRVLKDGAFLFAMSSPRQEVLSENITRIGKAGFDISFTSLEWVYPSGFAKAANLSKGVDKKLGNEREVIGIKPGHEEFAKRKTSGDTVFKDATEGFDRPWMHDPESRERYHQLTAPSSLFGFSLNGAYSGYQPKPSREIIIVAMRPISEKTYREQALKNGHGCTWLDDARIPFQSKEEAEAAFENSTAHRAKDTWKKSEDTIYEGGHGVMKSEFRPEGRFPANILVSGDALNDGQGWDAGGRFPADGGKKTVNVYGDYPRHLQEPFSYGDSGSFSRYFSLDQWWSEQIKKLPEHVRKTFPFLIESKVSPQEREEGLESWIPIEGLSRDEFQKRCQKCNRWRYPWLSKSCTCEVPEFKVEEYRARNAHSTVKPIPLMSYLITMGSRKGDIVLDPFCGSGSTLKACRIMARQFIGIDKVKENCEIARKRLQPEMEQHRL